MEMGQARLASRLLCAVDDPDADADAPMLQVFVHACPQQLGDSDAAVVALVGELCAYSAALVEPALRSFAEYARRVVVDLAGLTFIDAAGLHLLVSLAGHAGTVTVDKVNARIRHTFEIADLDHVLGRPRLEAS